MKTKVMTRKCTQIGVEQTEGNKRSYPYLYPIKDLAQKASIEASMCASTKEASWKVSQFKESLKEASKCAPTKETSWEVS